MVCLLVDRLVGFVDVWFVGLWLVLWSVGRLIDFFLVFFFDWLFG